MKKMNDLISIIIPVYKAEKYLPRCIESVIAQTYKNIETILIDDGSPDSSGRICDEYAAKDPRIIVIHKENGGVSSARNAGLDVSRGKYICFVDSDDYILEDYVERLYMAVSEKNADIASCGFLRKTGGVLQRCGKNLFSDMTENHTEKNFYYKLCIDFKADVPWNKIYRADIIRNNSIRFSEELRMGEDFVFVIVYSAYVRCAAYLSEPLYVYVDSDTSVCKSSESNSFFENDERLAALLDKIIEESSDPRYADSVRIRRMFITIHLIYDKKKYKLERDVSQYRSYIRKNLLFFLSYPLLPLRIKLRYILMILSPSLFDPVKKLYRRIIFKK